ncbi:hypothetical protein MIND_01021700 [Mycena indigotica]|uniref:precorrin-2 dehydrogenase n=1 Tax=Mycena indigotica TaxID=2126181 RepID=A0A8H6S8J6_9AGAR|nr:uncharacterized protein MIND_01021700 [Mycena indigotica]KAF7294838.1 hypothetical protein MIND_01021700 [Mycena indigotica]
MSKPTLSQTGGSLLIAWQLKDKNVLIVGGGELLSKAYIPAQKSSSTSTPSRITYYDRRFSGPAEIHKMDMVLTALDDANRSREICEMCRKARIAVNAADIPDLCDFYFGAQIRDGPLQIMISTNGNGPRMAALMKKKIQAALSGSEGEAIDRVGVLRAQLKERSPGVGGPLGRRRMKWMSEVCNTWEIDDLTKLDDAAITKLLDEGWEKNTVPSPQNFFSNHSRASKISLQLSHVGDLIPFIGTFALGGLCATLLFLGHRHV